MVAKQIGERFYVKASYLLAKIHMVAKLVRTLGMLFFSYLLAKIHMVAKPQTDFIT